MAHFCPQCKSRNRNIVVDVFKGDVVCQDCGLVLRARIARDCPEWRAMSNGRRVTGASRVGSVLDPFRYSAQAALCSRVGARFFLGERASIHPGKDPESAVLNRKKMKVLALSAAGAMTGRDLLALHAYGQIDRLAALLCLNSRVLHLATALYRKARDAPISRSRPLNAVCATVVYVACRQLGVPRSLKEIAACPACAVNAREVGRTYCALARAQSILSRQGAAVNAGTFQLPMARAATGECERRLSGHAPTSRRSGFIRRFCSNLALPSLIHVAAVEVSRRVQSLQLLRTRSPSEAGAIVIFLILTAMNTARPGVQGNSVARRCDYLGFFERLAADIPSPQQNPWDLSSARVPLYATPKSPQISLNGDLPPVPTSAAGRAYESYLGNLTPQQRRPRRKLSRRDQRQLRALGCLGHTELSNTVARACSVSACAVRAGYIVLHPLRHVLLPERFVKWWGVSLLELRMDSIDTTQPTPHRPQPGTATHTP